MQKRPEFTRIRAALGRSIHFRDLASEDLDRIAELCRLRKLEDGQAAPSDGGERSSFFIVVSGSVRLSAPSREGEDFVYAVLGPGSFYGIGSMIRGGTIRALARAFGATELAIADGERFLALLDSTPRLWRHIAGLLHSRLTHAMWAMRDNGVAPLEERVVRRLLAHAAASGDGLAASVPLALRLTQADLGRMLATSRSRVNGVLKRLESDGLIEVGYRSIKLRDMARLREVAGDVFAF